MKKIIFSIIYFNIIIYYIMVLKHTRKVNKGLKSWVAFVKKVQKEEHIKNYREAISRAKVRKDKGEKWMTGGTSISDEGEMSASDEYVSDNQDSHGYDSNDLGSDD
jgi:hypothetical protein